MLHVNSKETPASLGKKSGGNGYFLSPPVPGRPAGACRWLARRTEIVKTGGGGDSEARARGQGEKKPRARAARAGGPGGGRRAQPEHKAARRLAGHRTSLGSPRVSGARANTMHPGLGRGGSNT